MASRIFRVFKTIPFADGGEEEFSNVYRYSVGTAGTGFPQDRAMALIDALVNEERQAHGSQVNFTRVESAPVSVLNGIGTTDITVDLNQPAPGYRDPADNSSPVAPENVIMVQERVGPKRWLRKFLHSCSVGFEISPDRIALSYDTADSDWASIEAYASSISPLTFTEPDGSVGEAVLEAGNGTPSQGNFVADPRIRWHDLKY